MMESDRVVKDDGGMRAVSEHFANLTGQVRMSRCGSCGRAGRICAACVRACWVLQNSVDMRQQRIYEEQGRKEDGKDSRGDRYVNS